MEEHFSDLAADEQERLALLVEECGEVIQIAMKILRHGYESFNPFDDKETPNRKLLAHEIGDLELAIELMKTHYDIKRSYVEKRIEEKRKKVGKYLHHNKV